MVAHSVCTGRSPAPIRDVPQHGIVPTMHADVPRRNRPGGSRAGAVQPLHAVKSIHAERNPHATRSMEKQMLDVPRPRANADEARHASSRLLEQESQYLTSIERSEERPCERGGADAVGLLVELRPDVRR